MRHSLRRKDYQKELTEIGATILQLEERIKKVAELQTLEQKKRPAEDTLNNIKAQLKDTNSSTEKNILYQVIRKSLEDIVSSTLHVDASLSWRLNQSDNIEFDLKILDSYKKGFTAADEGRTFN